MSVGYPDFNRSPEVPGVGFFHSERIRTFEC